MKVDPPFAFNNDVQPACLPDPDFAPEDAQEISNLAYASGWGYAKEGKVRKENKQNFTKQAFSRLVVLLSAKITWLNKTKDWALVQNAASVISKKGCLY